jgi:hypothetical protein
VTSAALLSSCVMVFLTKHPPLQSWRAEPSALLTLGFLAAVVATPLLVIARLVARARLRASGHDAFARFRSWAAAGPRVVVSRRLLAWPMVIAFFFSSDRVLPMLVNASSFRSWAPPPSLVAWAVGLWIVSSVVGGLVGRGLLQGLFAPLTAPVKSPSADEFTFSAVAVTPEARAAVGGILALSVAAMALAAYLPQQIVYGTPGVAGFLAYVALVAGGALAFQRASRIGVGLDGVLVTGSSRTRFYGYRDLDDVEATRWGDVLLRRGGRVVLRLQLHGEDEGRHQAIADRIREGITLAGKLASGGAQRLAEAVGPAPLAHAARGQGSFRAPGATREELWELVEAPATSGAARSAAAEALALEADRADRARLRVAAERCAEPTARAALMRIVVDEEAAEEEAAEYEASSVVRK